MAWTKYMEDDLDFATDNMMHRNDIPRFSGIDITGLICSDQSYRVNGKDQGGAQRSDGI